jgi:hypothetical protein
MISKKMFIGFEVEGPEIGFLTLFIPRGSIKKTGEIRNIIIDSQLNINRIYFGAGERRGITKLELKEANNLKKEFTFLKFIFEISLSDQIPKNVPLDTEIVLSIKTKNCSLIDVVKLEDNRNIRWLETNNAYISKITNPLYLMDKEPQKWIQILKNSSTFL